MPWMRGVSGMSPSTLPVAPSITITCVRTRDEHAAGAGLGRQVVGPAFTLDVELLGLERLGMAGSGGRRQHHESKQDFHGGATVSNRQ